MSPLTIANLSLFSGQEDQFIKVSIDVWESIVPSTHTKGKKCSQGELGGVMLTFFFL